MPDPNVQAVLFLFGDQPAESAVLEAQTLLRLLPSAGWSVRLAALSRKTAHRLRGRLGEPVEPINTGPRWLGPLRRWRRLPPGTLTRVHAWDLQAAEAARILAPGRPIVYTTESAVPFCRAARVADVVIRRGPVADAEPASTGHTPGPLPDPPPAVDPSLLASARDRRDSIRRALGLAGRDPVVIVPPPVVRRWGTFEVAWAALIVRKAGIPLRLLLAHPGRESRRIDRFSLACDEPGAVVTAPYGTPWLDLLAAGDIVAVPAAELYAPALLSYAAAAGMPLVVPAPLASQDRLLAPAICRIVPDARPLSLARGLFAAWQARTHSSDPNPSTPAGLPDPHAAAAAMADLYARLDRASGR